MIMAQKHLHELLREDQEPFKLKNYITDRQWQLKRPSHKSSLKIKNHTPIVHSSAKKLSLYKQACFLSFQNSPDVRKSPCKSPDGTVFLHVPANTAALLLESAIRIQKQSSISNAKTQVKNSKFGLLGSILKRMKDRNSTKKHELGNDDHSFVSREESLRKFEKVKENVDEKNNFEMGFSCNNSRLSSAGWSESNEEKSLDLETLSSSCMSEDFEEEIDEFVDEEREKHFCSSPFRFSLLKSPPSGRLTPEFLTPVTSPRRHKKEEKENYELESLRKIQQEEEEKEQCSPVSVLDIPFDDDDEGHECADVEEDDVYDVDCSYAIVQRAKQNLLHKLNRFEKLAELDPIELEKIMLEDQDDEYDNEDLDENEEREEDNPFKQNNVDELVFSIPSLHHLTKIPTHMKRLVADLIDEEKKEMNALDDNEVVRKRVCKRLDSWREIDYNTIDMMVDLDFRKDFDVWSRYKEQVGETAVEIELSIFELLVKEVSEELVSFSTLL